VEWQAQQQQQQQQQQWRRQLCRPPMRQELHAARRLVVRTFCGGALAAEHCRGIVSTTPVGSSRVAGICNIPSPTIWGQLAALHCPVGVACGCGYACQGRAEVLLVRTLLHQQPAGGLLCNFQHAHAVCTSIARLFAVMVAIWPWPGFMVPPTLYVVCTNVVTGL
jgi:hypothetical protein